MRCRMIKFECSVILSPKKWKIDSCPLEPKKFDEYSVAGNNRYKALESQGFTKMNEKR